MDGAAKEIQERGKPDAAAVVADMGDATEPVDLIEGDGDAVIEGGIVEIEYSIVNPADGTELESSWGLRMRRAGTQPIPLDPGVPELQRGSCRHEGRRPAGVRRVG